MVDGWTVPGFTPVRELGRGASGRVMLAVDDVTQTRVAIKYLDDRLRADESFMHRFRAEARRLSQLEDPGVADLYEFVEGADGAAVVMQWIEGVSLRRILDAQGPTGPPAALAALGGALAGLATAHTAGLVHHDFKPSNLLIAPDGQGHITDFGITPPRASRSGDEPPGSPAYLAPELWDGAAVSPATDLYAATVLFFECLTGRLPYQPGGSGGRALAALGRAHREAPIPTEAVPGPLRGLIARGLAKNPADRPTTAEEFLVALEEAAVAAYGPVWETQGRSRLAELSATAAAAPPPSPPPSVAPGGPGATARRGSRPRLVGSLAAIAVIAVVGAGAVLYGMNGGDGDGTSDAQTVSPSPSSTPSAAARPTRSAGPDASGRVLAARIERSALQRPGASFSHRQTGKAAASVNARGTFRLLPGRESSYSMVVSSNHPRLRQATQTVLVGRNGYVRVGSRWQSVPTPATRPDGYASLAARVRAVTSVPSVSVLLRNARTLDGGRRGYRGTVPLKGLSGGPYEDLARATGASHAGFVLTLDASGLPRRLLVTVGSGTKAVTMTTTYTGWGKRVTIKAPR
ncbi:serine/threonine-protein kinase [Thermomonospora umbrina]|uniref:non-specific serine/threonine protein kinase n=1 Tax=Thermomonospora umbrina TaxID=111806 RepID=A0A3D9SPY0_9ACTN|nr:serine/threonine-protein kinase [Thermomonospora umbrina]REE98012.1 serine/threonine protein kinase [Thermomonospora umbrina]